MNINPLTQLGSLLSDIDSANLPKTTKNNLFLAMSLIGVAENQYQNTKVQAHEALGITNAASYFEKVQPYFTILESVSLAARSFIVTRQQLTENLNNQLTSLFIKVLGELDSFQSRQIISIEESNPEIKEHFRKSYQTGKALEKIALASFDGFKESPINQTDLAVALGSSTANATGIRDSLEQIGFVEISRDAADRRRVYSKITKSGWKALTYFELGEKAKVINTILNVLERKV